MNEMPPKTHKLSFKGPQQEMLVGWRKQEMRGCYVVCRAPGLVQASEETWPLLHSSGVFFLFHSKFYTDAPDQLCSNRFCYQDGQRPENYYRVTIQHFGALRQGRSEAEALLLSEWVQTAVAKLIRMIQEQESVSPAFSFTLYCADMGP